MIVVEIGIDGANFRRFYRLTYPALFFKVGDLSQNDIDYFGLLKNFYEILVFSSISFSPHIFLFELNSTSTVIFRSFICIEL